MSLSKEASVGKFLTKLTGKSIKKGVSLLGKLKKKPRIQKAINRIKNSSKSEKIIAGAGAGTTAAAYISGRKKK